MDKMTKKQMEIIKDNLSAYCANFEKPVIINDGGFYVYRNEQEYEDGSGSYVQYCYNIDYLNGWLYGAVQASCKQLRQIDKY